MGGARLAVGSDGQPGLRTHGRSHRVAPPPAPSRLAPVRGQPARGDVGGRGVRRLGARRGRSGSRFLGTRGAMGGAAARMAGLLRAGAGLPPRTRRAPLVAPLEMGGRDHADRADTSHPRNALDASGRLRLRPARQHPRAHCTPADGGLDAGRGRAGRLGCLPAPTAASLPRRRTRCRGRAAAALPRRPRCWLSASW